MNKSRSLEPDGYVKMRIRDFMVGAFIVSCFALAALVSHIWRNIIKKTGPDSRIKPIRFANQSK